MKRLISALLLSAAFFTEAMPPAEDVFRIFREGRPNAAIELPGAEYAERINQFNQILRRVCGNALPVCSPGQTPPRQQRIVFQIIRNSPPLEDDRFMLDFPDRATLRITCTDVSLQWALNMLLEEYAGVRWLFPERCGLSYRHRSEIAIPRTATVRTPSFPLRRFVERTHPSWYPKARFKDSLDMNHLLLKYVFPAERYDKEGWPENIMPLLNGKKLKSPPKEHPNGRWQPCYSHPDTARAAAENICAWLAEHPGQKSISLIQNDVGGFCECSSCARANGGRKYQKSEVYFRWVNAVAEKVAEKHPGVLFTAGAYVETKMPPSFPLHKNVIVILTMDLYQCVVPEIMKKQKAYIASWRKKAATLGVWDYSWGHGYVLPRVYFRVHAEMLRYLRRQNTLVYFGENECFDAKEGPKEYLVARLLWDVNADVDALLSDWYRNCVGEEAAPYLKEYYTLWENVMSGPEIRKTPWFKSAYTSVYMTWDGDRSHMYAVSEKDLAHARELMQQVVSRAGTAQEKERAALLLRHFEYMETILKLYGAEYLPPENTLKDAESAAAVLRSFERIPHLIGKRNRLAEEFRNDPVMGYYYRSRIYSRRLRFEEPASEIMLWLLSFALDFADAPPVQAELKKLADGRMPEPLVRSVAEALTNPEGNAPNLFPNGGMESPVDDAVFHLHPGHRKKGSGIRTSEKSFSGKFAWKVLPGDYSLVRFQLPAEPDSRYLFSFRIRSGDSGGRANIRYGLFPAKNTHNQAWNMLPEKRLPAGEWRKYIAFVQTRPDSNGINGYLFLNDFTGGEAVFLDDLKLVKLK